MYTNGMNMESILWRQMMMTTTISSTTQTLPIIKYPKYPLHTARPFSRFQHGRFYASSKQSDFQDFRNYAKASRLLPATEARMCTILSPETSLPYFGGDRDQDLYKVEICTSNVNGSGLDDSNVGLLICLIDENGNSILRRLPASSVRDFYFAQSDDSIVSDEIHFQRGSVDEFTFYGSKLGNIEAIWIGIESGQWRLGGVSLTVIYAHQTPVQETEENEILYNGLQYHFKVEDISLGEGSNTMTELRPSLITQLHSVDLFTIFNKSPSQSFTFANQYMSNEESMQEYADLKFSLLIYDATLIFLGTLVADYIGGDNAAFSFLTGGIVGFLYLLLLQRSVDGLPAPALSSTSNGNSFGEMYEGFKSPVLGLALALGVGIVILKYGSNEVMFVLTPKDLMVGMVGFLVCKVAVFLAAFKPMPMGLKENK